MRTIEIELGKGLAVVEACRKLGITEQTYYRWKQEYGGLRVDQAKRLKGLEQENARLKRLVAGEPQESRATVASGWAQGAAETAQSSAAVGGEWLVSPAAPALSESCLVE